MNDLKPCPNCGTDECVYVFEAETKTPDLEWQVGCSACYMCGPISSLKLKAIADWNNLPRREDCK